MWYCIKEPCVPISMPLRGLPCPPIRSSTQWMQLRRSGTVGMSRSTGISMFRPKSSFSRVHVRARTASGSLKFSLQDREKKGERVKEIKRETTLSYYSLWIRYVEVGISRDSRRKESYNIDKGATICIMMQLDFRCFFHSMTNCCFYNSYCIHHEKQQALLLELFKI